jgi:hypothetical protein
VTRLVGANINFTATEDEGYMFVVTAEGAGGRVAGVCDLTMTAARLLVHYKAVAEQLPENYVPADERDRYAFDRALTRLLFLLDGFQAAMNDSLDVLMLESAISFQHFYESRDEEEPATLSEEAKATAQNVIKESEKRLKRRLQFKMPGKRPKITQRKLYKAMGERGAASTRKAIAFDLDVSTRALKDFLDGLGISFEQALEFVIQNGRK